MIAAATPAKSGWNWAYYKPFVALALEYDLPLIAANLSRDDARTVMRQGLAASGFNPAVPADIAAAAAAEILAGHGGLLDAASAGRMALAQVARDQFMARSVQTHAPRGVLLLAGNGHVRTDVGVPRWLAPALRERSQSIGMLERGATLAAGAGSLRPYDRTIFTAPQARADPCIAMKMTALLPGS